MAATKPGWTQQLQEHGGQFAWDLARFGAWAYVAVTAIACLGFEYSIRKTQEYWTRFTDSCAGLWSPAAPKEEPRLCYGYDHAGEPVYDPHTPLAYDTEGAPLAGDDLSRNANTQPLTPSQYPGSASATAHGPLFDPASAHPTHGSQSGDVMHIAPHVATPEDGPLCPVVGVVPTQRVSRATALADPHRYWVDAHTGEIWDVRFREALLRGEVRQPTV